MSELDKLELYLKEHGYNYERKDENDKMWMHHQIVIFDNNGNKKWDAICHRGSYGYEQGLLETYGDIVDSDKLGDSVEGYLTAQDVIDRIKKMEERNGSID